jgi:hypothetical protein
LTSRDLHQGNVLVTKRADSATLTPVSTTAVLIDFGRGRVDHEIDAGNPRHVAGHNITKDISDYGFLIHDLVQQWMDSAAQTKLPRVVLDVIESALEQSQTSMGDISALWWTATTTRVGKEMGLLHEDPNAEEIDAPTAWESLPALRDSFLTATRSKPSALKSSK